MPLIQSIAHSVRFENRTQNAKGDRIIDPKELRNIQLSGKSMADAFFTINPGEVLNAPEWIKTDWNYAAHIRSGSIVELMPVNKRELAAAAAMIPSGSPAPKEAIDAGKVKPPPEDTTKGKALKAELIEK